MLRDGRTAAARARADGPDGVVRAAVRLMAVAIPATAGALLVLAVVTGDRSLLAWVVVGFVLGVVVIVDAALGRADIEALTVVIAIAIAAVAPNGPPSSVVAAVAAAVAFGVVLFTALEPSRLGWAAGIAAVVIHATTLVRVSAGWSGLTGALILLVGVASTWVVLDRIVKRLRMQHASYRELFDRVPVGLYRTGLGGELLDVNPALAELLGVSRESLIGRRAQEFFVDVGDFSQLRARIGDDARPVTTDIRFRRPDGALIWVRDQTRPVTDDDGDIVCFEGELQDVTEQKRHVEELEALVRSKSELIGAVSHELRTPLTAVLGFLELLQSGDAEDERELLELAVDQARDIAGIVDDLLTAARLENRELIVQDEEFDLRAAVDGAVASVVGTGSPELSIDIAPGLSVWADAPRVRQIVRNLVSNAVRYGTPPILIRARSAVDHVELTVTDRGSEIPRTVALRMFDAFFSGGSEDSSRQPGSIGLGLAVSQRLARLMGGDLRYARVGDETHFTLVLRRMPATELAETA